MFLDRRLFEGKIISSKVYPEFFPITPADEVVNFGTGVGPQAVVYKGSFKRMVGIDLNKERLEASKVLLAEHHIHDYETLQEPVDDTGLPAESFDKALAIDIIEHLSEPEKFLTEALRVLRSGGTMLVSVPAMHDHYVHAFRGLARLLGRKTKPLPEGHLDAHNTSLSLRGWEKMIRQSGFAIVRTRASTLWPPLHLYGLPRFWFTNTVIHAIDDSLCRIPGLKRFGQACLFVLRKP